MSALTADDSDGTGDSADRADVRERPSRAATPDPDRGLHSAGFGALFVGSDGTHYTDWQLERRLERGRWRCCLSQQRPERHLLEDDGGRLLVLERIDLDTAPPWLEIRIDAERAWAVDTRAVVTRVGDGATAGIESTTGDGSADSSRDWDDRRWGSRRD